MARLSKGNAAEPVTQQVSFGLFGADTFTVRDGIPLSDAMNELACLLGAAHEAVRSLASGEVRDIGGSEEPYASVYTLAMARAMQRAILEGYAEHLRGADMQAEGRSKP